MLFANPMDSIPRLYAAASLKPRSFAIRRRPSLAGIPRLYAAASLKLAPQRTLSGLPQRYSAALCRGLIEASRVRRIASGYLRVFRGSMPRPH